MVTYTLRVTYLTSSKRARVQNIRGLVWDDVLAIQNVLRNDPTTLRTDTTCERQEVRT